MIYCLVYNNLEGQARELQLIFDGSSWTGRILDVLAPKAEPLHTTFQWLSLYALLGDMMVTYQELMNGNLGFNLHDYFMDGDHKLNDNWKTIYKKQE